MAQLMAAAGEKKAETRVAEKTTAKKKMVKPIENIAAFVVVLEGAIILLAFPFAIGSADALGVLFLLFGLMLLPVSWYVFKGDYWSWGSALIILIMALLLAVPSLTYSVIAYGVSLAIVLFMVRRTYGVGVWKMEQAKEEAARKIREEHRTANPEGLHCPRCKSADLYIADDGSTFCRSCKVGFVNIRDVAAKPKSSMQV